jgi:hypothetical protein
MSDDIDVLKPDFYKWHDAQALILHDRGWTRRGRR